MIIQSRVDSIFQKKKELFPQKNNIIFTGNIDFPCPS